eukprot:12155730-Karenia_brevis.AAC.1
MFGAKGVSGDAIREVTQSVTPWVWGNVPVLGPDHFERAIEVAQDTGVGIDGIPYSGFMACKTLAASLTLQAVEGGC